MGDKYRDRVACAYMPGIPRNIGVQLDYHDWMDLEMLASSLKINKASLVRPLIKKLIEENRHLIEAEQSRKKNSDSSRGSLKTARQAGHGLVSRT